MSSSVTHLYKRVCDLLWWRHREDARVFGAARALNGWEDIGSGWKASPEEEHTFTESEMQQIARLANSREQNTDSRRILDATMEVGGEWWVSLGDYERLEEQLETCQKEKHVQNLEWAISLAESDPLYAEVFRPYFQKIVDALTSNPASVPDVRCPRCGMEEVCDEPDCPNRESA